MNNKIKMIQLEQMIIINLLHQDKILNILCKISQIINNLMIFMVIVTNTFINKI